MKILQLALISAASLVAMPAMAQTVADASFETPTVTNSPNYGTPAPGVTFTSGAGIEPNGGAFGYAPAPDGVQVAFLQGAPGGFGTINQSVSDLVAGHTYSLIFSIAARPNYAVLPVNVSFDGGFLSTVTPTSTSFTDVSRLLFRPTSTSGTLSFFGSATPGDFNAAIDNVRVAGVPEPATWGLMLLGMAGIGVAIRRRRGAAKLATI